MTRTPQPSHPQNLFMDHEHHITQWADGTLSGEALTNFEKAMATDSELRAEAEEAREMHKILSGNLTIERDIPNAQSFNSGILKAIEAEKIAPFVAPTTQKTNLLPWAIAAAACIAAASTLFLNSGNNSAATTRITYTPDPSIDAKVYIDEEAGATVILLDGIASIPDDQPIAPKTLISRALPGGSGSRAFFAKHDQAQPSMVLTRTSGGQVRIQDVY